MWKVCRYLEQCIRDPRVRRTDEQTDRRTDRSAAAIARCNILVRCALNCLETIKVWQPRGARTRRRIADRAFSVLLHREHGTGYRLSWNCYDRRTRFVVIWKHFCFILSTGTKIQIDSVMRPRSSSRRRNTSASVTVTVNTYEWLCDTLCETNIGRIYSMRDTLMSPGRRRWTGGVGLYSSA